jgi:hypothetical protein
MDKAVGHAVGKDRGPWRLDSARLGEVPAEDVPGIEWDGGTALIHFGLPSDNATIAHVPKVVCGLSRLRIDADNNQCESTK